jgi:type I restriction enzyme M protein
MNLAIRGISSDLGKENADSFHKDLHPDLKADFILANPPFNMSDWGGERLREDKRWKYGTPPMGNANYAWVQHFIHHLAPNGTAGFVLANGSMSSNTSGEGEIRKALIEADMVDCMVALPGQLFFSTPIPVCLWFLTRNKHDEKARNRTGETLFIDARKMGTLIDRVHRDLTEEDIAKIADVYHAWKAGGATVGDELQGDASRRPYEDVAGLCNAVTVKEIAEQGYVLTPGRYVGAAELEEDDEPFEEKIERLTKVLEGQISESSKLEKIIRENLQKLDHEQ